ncbi:MULTISPECIES: hypothetical protein [pseudomallei group]|uniref:Gp50, conserved domain protein n=1 Tax=Burkholderia phage phiE255 TaxID=2883942 RepID=A4JWP2_9CAUD|nr:MULTISPECIES: hypothetical protein [pseudomallei group]YP_001111250.1 gp50, conserved domain protein [Burkholderia phage phiE255]ABO60687.1 gp50, conserved domain protein [Burkholderia phage phiE255]AIS95675.1 hypothetical protein BTHA_3303 [Burkholderia thailandensis MSMB59]AOJ44328.1 hypothetical protein WJ27_03940 [Burkholderia thailandensis]KVG16808.1 hypothetical protein WJ28_11865 [Burkholderia thailandensis]MCS6426399.1 hypothetical protein [Burkholderia thailandensis]
MNIHPVIATFEHQAKILDVTGDTEDTDDAIALLAGWIDLSLERLTEADVSTLVRVGGLLFRDGLNRRNAAQTDR